MLIGSPNDSNNLEKTKILNNEWLSDININNFLVKLKEHFGKEHGLEDPLILTHCPSQEKFKRKDFVRVIFCSSQHWVCFTSKNSKAHTFSLYDSCPSEILDELLVETIQKTVLTEAKDKTIKIIMRDCQEQGGIWQCGYYALANATALLYGLNPGQLVYDENSLRNHYIQIVYLNRQLSMFPHEVKNDSIQTKDKVYVIAKN